MDSFVNKQFKSNHEPKQKELNTVTHHFWEGSSPQPKAQTPLNRMTQVLTEYNPSRIYQPYRKNILSKNMFSQRFFSTKGFGNGFASDSERFGDNSKKLRYMKVLPPSQQKGPLVSPLVLSHQSCNIDQIKKPKTSHSTKELPNEHPLGLLIHSINPMLKAKKQVNLTMNAKVRE